jgi:hypothetical protein
MVFGLLNMRKKRKTTKGNPPLIYGVGGQPKKVKSGVRLDNEVLVANPVIRNVDNRSIGRFLNERINCLGVTSPVTRPIPLIITLHSLFTRSHVTFVITVDVNTKSLSGIIPL